MNLLYKRGSFGRLSAHRGRLRTLCGIFTFRQDRAEAEEVRSAAAVAAEVAAASGEEDNEKPTPDPSEEGGRHKPVGEL